MKIIILRLILSTERIFLLSTLLAVHILRCSRIYRVTWWWRRSAKRVLKLVGLWKDRLPRYPSSLFPANDTKADLLRFHYRLIPGTVECIFFTLLKSSWVIHRDMSTSSWYVVMRLHCIVYWGLAVTITIRWTKGTQRSVASCKWRFWTHWTRMTPATYRSLSQSLGRCAAGKRRLWFGWGDWYCRSLILCVMLSMMFFFFSFFSF